MSRVGLGRHGRIEADAGDPLDGLVNLFDIGMILAVAFLIAGIGLALETPSEDSSRISENRGRVLPSPAGGPKASGRGEAVGRVFRLPDGRLVYVKDRREPPR